MRERDGILLVLTAGAAVGAVVLGLAGRIAMAGVALASGAAPNFSLTGLAQVLVYGAVLGALGGLVALPTRNLFPANRYARSAVVAAVLFVGSLLFPLLRGRLEFGAGPAQPFTLVVAAAVFLIYAAILDALLNRLEGRPRAGV